MAGELKCIISYILVLENYFYIWNNVKMSQMWLFWIEKMSSLVRLIVDESFSVMTTFPTFGLVIQSRLLLSCGGRALKCSASKEGSCLLVSVWSCWEVVAATTTSRSDTKPSHQDRQHEQEEEVDGHVRESTGTPVRLDPSLPVLLSWESFPSRLPEPP